MELQQAWRDVIRPTMRREPKTPGNRGVEVVMVDLDGLASLIRQHQNGKTSPSPMPRTNGLTTTATTKARRCIATSLPLAVVQTRRNIAGGCSSVITLIPVG